MRWHTSKDEAWKRVDEELVDIARYGGRLFGDVVADEDQMSLHTDAHIQSLLY